MPDTDAGFPQPSNDSDVAAPTGAEAPPPPAVEAQTLQEAPRPVPEPVDEAPPWPWIGLGGALLLAGLAAWATRSRPVPSVPASEGLEADDDVDVTAEAPPRGLGAQLTDRLARTRGAFRAGLDALLGRESIDEEALEALEDALLLADVGVSTAERLVGAVRDRMGGESTDPQALREALRDEMLAMLHGVQATTEVPRAVDGGPFVLLVVGVNGSGKTTTIGKLSARWVGEGRHLVLGAADTFRAAAADQLAVWAERAGCAIVQQPEGADPAAVAFSTMDRALADGADLAIIDTAGRLQNARPLMEQLTKIRRVIDKKVGGAPHETWLVIDGTMGQNALAQARAFHEATPLTGVVVTKLDGTAKGGMVLAIAQELGLPVRYIGVGEGIDDLRPFDADAFVDALL